jgi:hypothetical protein
MGVDQILPQLFVGSHPASLGDLEQLRRDLRITAVLNLQTDNDMGILGVDWPRLLDGYRQLGLELRRVPIHDFDSADLQRHLPEAVAALSRLLQAGHTVYVHCTAGIGRSASTAVAYLAWAEKWGLDRAMRHVLARHACTPNSDAIRLATEDWNTLHGDEF